MTQPYTAQMDLSIIGLFRPTDLSTLLQKYINLPNLKTIGKSWDLECVDEHILLYKSLFEKNKIKRSLGTRIGADAWSNVCI